MRNRTRVLPAVLLLAASTACGTTVQPLGAPGPANGMSDTSLGTASGAAAPANGGPLAAGSGATGLPTTEGGTPDARAGQVAGAPGGTGGRAQTSTGALSATGARRPANVAGVTDTSLKFGVEYFDTADLAAYGNAAGVKAVGSADMLEAYRIAADWVNKHGGVAGGRKIVLVPRKRSTSESTAAAAQASCAAFTEDDHVFAANADLTEDSPLVPCLAKHGVLSVTGGMIEAGSRDDFLRYKGLYVGPSTAETVSAADTYVEALVRQGLIAKGSTVGLLWFDFADFVLARKAGLLPALARHGLSIKSEYRGHYSGNPSDLGPIAGQMQAAALQFRSDGVDRVLTLDYQGTLAYFFMQQAQQQGYHPRYGLASWSDLQFLAANGNAAQLVGSTGIGWLPAYDLDPQRQPKLKPLVQCLAMMRAGGMPAQAQGDYLIEYYACARIFFLQALLDKASDLTPAGLRAALDALGRQPSYAGLGDRFSSRRPWGAAVYRDLVFDPGCSCGSYRGPDRAFS